MCAGSCRTRICSISPIAHVPYGRRSAESVQQLSLAVTRFLLEQGAKLIVVACNTASAAAFDLATPNRSQHTVCRDGTGRQAGAQSTQTGSVGVLATQAHSAVHDTPA